MYALTYFTLSFGFTLWFSHFLLRYVDPSFFIDKPNLSKLHKKPRSRYGGIAFGIVTIVLAALSINNSGEYNWYLLGAIFIILLGAVDDHISISWWVKLFVQIFIGLMILFHFLPQVNHFTFLGTIQIFEKSYLIPFFLFWFLGIVNSVNLIDGLDGLAGGVAIIMVFSCSVLGYFIGGPAFMHLNIILSASLLAFLHFNLQPSRFFMGDSGSLFLGFHLAVTPILMFFSKGKTDAEINFTPFIIMTSFLIIDTSRVFFERLRFKKNPFLPDKTHFHYLLIKKLKSHNLTLLVIFFLNTVACAISIFATIFNVISNYFVFAYLGFVFIFVFVGSLTRIIIGKLKTLEVKTKPGEQFPVLQDTIFRLPYLSYVLSLYFIILFLSKYTQILKLPIYQSASLSFILITIIVLVKFFKNIYLRPDAVLIMIASLQLFFIIPESLISSINKGMFDLMSSWIRFGSLAASAIIFFDSVIFKGKKLINNFLSFSDLLFFMVLIGFLGFQNFELGQVFTIIVEIAIIYLANKLLFISLSPNFKNAN
ncbi:MAG: hypothetical protein CMG57_08790 [Candidatus Marinimicrobia bacterium]|nr:hypothetical protein [Candidatus Neomarinimicrobiota bacterium]|tara:strand:- start:2416 stop:4029 length:1614 start_codon:yes stop_codon:yes gene_type:complete